MKRNLSAGVVTIAGLLFAAAGAYAMWTGWDMILLERGWSLFIGGSVLLSSGLVTVALGRVIALLARILAQRAAGSSERLSARAASPPPPPAPVTEPVEPITAKPEVVAKPEPAPASAPLPPRLASEPEPFERRKPFGVREPFGGRASAPARASASAEETLSEKMSAIFEASRERPIEEPTEVDRYEAGGALYIMMSDGSLDVHGPEGVQHYPSIEALKAEAGLQEP